MVSPRKRHYPKPEDGEQSPSDQASSSSKKRPDTAFSGLVRSEEVRSMVEDTRNERARILTSDGVSQGETVHRLGGRVVSESEWKEARMRDDPRYRRDRQKELDREFNEKQEKESGWKRGMEQSSERQRKAEEAVRIASLPIGIATTDDSSINRKRWDDPMTRIKSEYVSPVPSSVKPMSLYEAPSNRFNIRAGYRWDGVVRGTNYEQRWFERQNESRNRGVNFSND